MSLSLIITTINSQGSYNTCRSAVKLDVCVHHEKKSDLLLIYSTNWMFYLQMAHLTCTHANINSNKAGQPLSIGVVELNLFSRVYV